MAIDGSIVNKTGRWVATTWQRATSNYASLWMSLLAGNVSETSTSYAFTMNISLGFNGYENRFIWEQGYIWWYADDTANVHYGPYQQGYFDATATFETRWCQEITHVIQKESRAKLVMPYGKILGIARPDIPAAGMGNRDNHYTNGDFWIFGNQYGLLEFTEFASWGYGAYDGGYNGVNLDAVSLWGGTGTGDGFQASECPIRVGSLPNVWVHNSSGSPRRATAIYVYDSSGKPRRATSITVYNSSGKPRTQTL